MSVFSVVVACTVTLLADGKTAPCVVRELWIRASSVFVFQLNVCFCRVRFSFSSTSQELGWEVCLGNDLFCVELYVKP